MIFLSQQSKFIFQEMIWQIRNKVDKEGGKTELHYRFPFLEQEMFLDPTNAFTQEMLDSFPDEEKRTVAFAKSLPSPR